jgi:hypothetical protein
MLGRPRLLVAATRWHEAGKVDYALRGKVSVLCLCRDARGYGFMPQPADTVGSDVIIVGRGLSADVVNRTYGDRFETIEELAPVTIRHAGTPAFDLSLFFGRAYRGGNAR